MKRIQKRTWCVLLLVLGILIGLVLYIWRLAAHGGEWAAQPYNRSVYRNGILQSGTITDRNGVILATADGNGGWTYAEDISARRALLHLIGDSSGNIGTGALSVYADRVTGYDFVTGTYGGGGTLVLSVDAELCRAASEALAGRRGTVAVVNYETGELLCAVSSGSYDPANPPKSLEGEAYEGVYMHRLFSAAYTPGSVFKLVTAAAAIENLPDLYERVFTCTGSAAYTNGGVSCMKAHGTLAFEDALADSCNCVFAELASELGGEILSEYCARFGLTGRQTVDRLQTAAGKYTVFPDGTADLAWSGAGQAEDLLNPASMLRFVAAIANQGSSPALHVLKQSDILPFGGNVRLMKTETAEALARVMHYCVVKTYGADNYPGLELYAKSGTAEVGGGAKPHAWFVGFIRNEGIPLAFVVVVENGGSGSAAAGAVANSVLQTAIKNWR